MFAFDILRDVAVIDPPVTMATDFVSVGHGRLRNRRIARQSHGDGEDGYGNLLAVEQIEQPPDADPAAIFVDGFHTHMALAGPGCGADNFREKSLRGFVAVQDVVLATFFVIHNELHGQSRSVRPIGLRRIGTVTDKVSCIVVVAQSCSFI